MPDNLVLYGPGGASPVNVGSWLQADPGPDFGAAGLIRALYAENPAVEGGALIQENPAIRRMGFPLLVRGFGGLSLEQTEAMLRLIARPGGYLDVQPEGTPSAEAVRFDVLSGRWEPAYNVHHNRHDVRLGSLLLDTRPYGYWPTEIILATQAAATQPFQMPINPASIIGDAPAQFRVYLRATHGQAGALASQPAWETDGMLWSMSRASGATVMLHPSAFAVATVPNQPVSASNSIFSATVITGDAYAPLGVTRRIGVSPTIARWFHLANFTATHLGLYGNRRFRVIAFMRTTPSWAYTVSPLVTADTSPRISLNFAPLASGAPVATLIPQANGSIMDTASAGGGFADVAASHYALLDLGVHGIASGPMSKGWTLRLWGYWPTSNLGVATPHFDIGGVYLQPVDGPAGIVPRGLIVPSQVNYHATGAGVAQTWRTPRHVVVDGETREALLVSNNGGAGEVASWTADERDLAFHHRGQFPVGPAGSIASLDALFIQRKWGATGATNMAGWAKPTLVEAAVSYRPRFHFLRGL